MKKCWMILITMMLLLCLYSCTSDDNVGYDNENHIYSTCAPLYLRPIASEKNEYAIGETILQQYEIVASPKTERVVVSCEYINAEAVGPEVIEIVDDETVSISFRVTEVGESTVRVNVCSYEGDDVIYGKRASVYAFANETKVFVSVNSQESAYKQSLDGLENVEKTNVSTYDDPIINQNEQMLQSNVIRIMGTIEWVDTEDRAHAVDNITVKIYDKDVLFDDLIATVTTSSGVYSVDVDLNDSWNEGDSIDLYIEISTCGANINVTNSESDVYTYTSEVYENLSADKHISKRFSEDEDINMALSVHQAMMYANKYIQTLEGSFLDSIDVSFPDPSQGITCFDMSNPHIYVISDDGYDWDVLQHEFGHYVQWCYGISDSPGGFHGYADNLSDLYDNKSTGVRLAWSEGWATYFAIKSQIDLSLQNRVIPYVGDTVYTDSVDGGFEYDIENVDSDYLLGEGNEVTVSGILYDLTDPKNTLDYDNTYFSYTDVWNITKSNYCSTLSDLFYGIYNATYSTSAKLSTGNILTHFNVSAFLSDNPTGLDGDTPRFSWQAQGGSTEYPNNYFSVSFFDEDYNLVYQTSYVPVLYYLLTSFEWDNIDALTSDVFYCCVQTKQNGNPTTGPYYSNMITVTKP